MQNTTNKATWVKCTYRADTEIVNGYGVSVDLGVGNIPWPVGCHKVGSRWHMNDMLTGDHITGYNRMPTVSEIVRAMPCFISHIEYLCHAEESDETRVFSSPEIRAYKTLAVYYPRVYDVTVRELCPAHYLGSPFTCMHLRMGWHAKED